MMSSGKLWAYVGIISATAIFLALAIYAVPGLLIPGLVVTASLWWGIPQARLWWATRDVHREMRREVRELTRRR